MNHLFNMMLYNDKSSSSSLTDGNSSDLNIAFDNILMIISIVHLFTIKSANRYSVKIQKTKTTMSVYD
jgi:hypothetical protein